ncbi:MAG: zincin-like metallopeptidase domain-containing protein [Promethearchaeota archaeon]
MTTINSSLENQIPKRTFIKNVKNIKQTHKEVVDLLINSISKQLEDVKKGKEVKWIKPWTVKGIAHTNALTPYRAYSPYNQLICSLLCLKNNWNSTFWITPKALQKYKIRLKKNQEINYIYGSIPTSISNINKENEENESIIKYYSTNYYIIQIPIYNLDQCYKKDVLKLNLKIKRNRFRAIKNAEEIIENMPNKPFIHHIKTGKAYYDPYEDSIYLPIKDQFKNSSSYYETIFHELAHSTGHQKRLKRFTLYNLENFEVHNYSKEELIAEMASTMVMNNCGLTSEKVIENQAAYLSGWLDVFKEMKRSKPQYLAILTNTAAKAADYILGNIKNGKKSEAKIIKKAKKAQNKKKNQYFNLILEEDLENCFYLI